MKLSHPFMISSRLMAAVQCGEATISLGYSRRAGSEGRTRYEWYIDAPGIEAHGDDLQSGCQGGSIREGMESLLSFLSACGEALNYSDRTGHESENADLFPRDVAEWAAANSDELSMLALEVEGNAECAVE